MVLWKLLNTCGWIFGAWFLLQLKSQSMREASHQPTFIGHCWTISHTFYSPIYLVDEGNEDVRSVGDVILLFFLFGVNQVHWLGLKPGAWGEYLICIVSGTITEFGERLKCQHGDTSWVWCDFHNVVGSPQLSYICGLLVNASRLNCKSPSLIPRWAEHWPIYSSEIVKFFVKYQWSERWNAWLGYN